MGKFELLREAYWYQRLAFIRADIARHMAETNDLLNATIFEISSARAAEMADMYYRKAERAC